MKWPWSWGGRGAMAPLKVYVGPSLLVDADQKQQTDQLIQLWIRGLKHVLYEADDLLDELHTQHLLRQRDGKEKGKGKVCDLFSCSNSIVLRYKIAGKISKIKEKFNAIAERVSKLNLNPRVVEMKHEKSDWRETSSLVHQEDIVGREEDKKHVIDLLLTNNSNQNVSSVAIVGIGGLGKTALAQLVYNDADVRSFFSKRMWVCVSDEFDIKVLVKKMLESLADQKEDDGQQLDGDDNKRDLKSFLTRSGDHSLESLQTELQKNLNGQGFLLVLDDIWNEDTEKWLRFKEYLRCGAKHSKILLTTRSQTAAEKMEVKMPHLLKGLENDQSWALLKRLAFKEDQTQNRESIGKKIAKKCVGVPLAIRVMGSLLKSKSKESDWEAILEDDFWKSLKDDNSIMPILKLSYDSLTIELKQCFAYCSLYPKDWRYKKDELIDLWMAQGFLENGKQFPEDVGEEYVHILLTKSFSQDVEMDKFGEIKYFKMHDLMHDMSQKIAGSDYCLDVDEGRENVVMCPIHATFGKCSFGSSLNRVDPSRLRTILKLGEEYERNPCDLFVFKRLHSLDISGYRIRDLPKSICKMSHLRYLNLSHCGLTCLPKGISNLINLQTLILNGCRHLKFSGEIITKLINLRRLDIKGSRVFEDGMPIGLGRMATLQHLSNFRVRNDDKQRKKAKLNELKELNLRGKLAIENLGLIRKVEEESKDVNLRSKKNLISLTLQWGNEHGRRNADAEMKSADALQLLENLCPHPNLKGLTIWGYPGVYPPSWLLTSTNLVQLRFLGCRNCQYLPALEGLVSLKTLHIIVTDALDHIRYKGCSSSTNFFPSLEELKIWSCRNLRGWQREADGHNTRDNERRHSLPPFPRLSSLDISNCPNLSCMPTFPNLVRHLELWDYSMKPLIDTLNVSSTGPSTSHDSAPSLFKLKDPHLSEIDIEALPEEWMRNLAN
ncbi:putative disease resistance protein RGA3 [Prosopis cineraria]|uniref:putative disease resistance protein RGA3 n=1 Tax=Prosopis cineraria TaxID=364024 RepID=UPI00240F147E|nr:putative disease resistance protein RGA3 [Prosopis cineraria]